MNILYICTHNRCRSILSEAITRQLAGSRISVFSAGSQPAGQVHPDSLKYLQERGYSVDGLASKSWDEFEDAGIDIVITVCDSAASESCPVWFGNALKVHWGLADPSKLTGGEEEKRAAFFRTIDIIEDRVRTLLTLNLENLSTAELTEHLVKQIKSEEG